MENFGAALHFTILYMALVIFSFFSGAFEDMQPKMKKRYIFIVFFVFGILMAFRSENMGNDTVTYIKRFYSVVSYSNPIDAINSSSSEMGYVLYSWILGQISPNPRILFVVTSIIICVSFGTFIYRHCENPGVFCCLFMGILLFDFVLSAVRQSIAIALILFVFDALLERKIVRYYFLTICACLFHNAASIFLVIYPVYWFISNQGKFRSVSIALILFLVCIFVYYYDSFVRVVLRFFPKYEYYYGGSYLDGEPRLAIILKIAVYALLLFLPKILRRSKGVPTRMESVTIFFAVVNILFLLGAMRTTLLTRITDSILPICILQYANNLQKFVKSNRNILVVMTCVAFYAYGLTIVIFRTPEWQTTYPIDLSWLI